VEIRRFRELAVSTPALCDFAESLVSVRNRLLRQGFPKLDQAVLRARLEQVASELNQSPASPIERLLIEHVLTCWLRLEFAERVYHAKVVGQSTDVDTAASWDQFLAAAQRRFLASVESLARVRRLAARSPLLQVNIAQAGGQQVNVQEASGEAAGSES
jgi:hypothetical protein